MDYNKTNTYRKTVLIEKISSKNVKLVFIQSCKHDTFWYKKFIGYLFYIENPLLPLKINFKPTDEDYRISEKSGKKFRRYHYVLKEDCQIIQ